MHCGKPSLTVLAPGTGKAGDRDALHLGGALSCPRLVEFFILLNFHKALLIILILWVEEIEVLRNQVTCPGL